jgi:hypothetical protein
MGGAKRRVARTRGLGRGAFDAGPAGVSSDTCYSPGANRRLWKSRGCRCHALTFISRALINN